MYEFNLKRDFKIFLDKKNIIEYVAIFVTLIVSYNLKYSFVPESVTSLKAYGFDLKILDISKIIFNNFSTLLMSFFPTILLLNPITLYFFVKFFLKKDQDKSVISLLKYMFLTSLFFIIFLPIGSADALISFAYGNRIWEIFILNYLILIFYFISKIKDKFDLILKNIFFYSIPIFLCINLLLIKDRVNHIITYDNFYHDDKNISKFLSKAKADDKILIDLNETNFYYLLSKGLITKNFFIKKFIKPNEINNYNYSIIENPLKLTARSGLTINNLDKITYNTNVSNFSIMFYSLIDQKVSINEKSYKVKEGLNNFKLSGKKIIFTSLDQSIYLTGIKIFDEQKSNWPWYSNFKFTIHTEIYTWALFLDKKIDIIKEFDFKKLSKSLNQSLNSSCKKQLISDVDSSLIFSLNCS